MVEASRDGSRAFGTVSANVPPWIVESTRKAQEMIIFYGGEQGEGSRDLEHSKALNVGWEGS
jgi:hypothetical protein